MKYINYAKELEKVVLPRYQESKPEKPSGFVRDKGDSKIKVTQKQEERKVEEIDEKTL